MPEPLPPRAHAALTVLAARLDRAGVRWVLAGSAGRALLGHRVRPADLDVEVAAEDAAAAGAALDAPLRPEAGRGRRSLRARTVVAGVEVDVTADLEVAGPTHVLPPDAAIQLGEGLVSRLGDRTIPLAPAEEAIARAIVLGDWAAVARVASQAAAGAPEPPRTGYLLRRLSSARSRASA